MNEFDLEFESLGQVNPQLQRDTVNLNIGDQQAEFERQNRGAERVQRQVEANQKQMIENLKTEAENSGLKYKDMEKLAQFSQTLTEKVVGYQKFKNEQKVQTGMMKAYANGYTPEEMAEFKAEEGALNAAQTEANKAAYEFEQRGGPADVAQELRNMTGWEAYGYAKGMLQKAGGNFGGWLAERANMVVMNLNGKQLSLNSADNTVEREMVMRAHRETYISQFTGMNPKLLNEYLYKNMKKAEATATAQWNADFKARQEKENQGKALDALGAQILDDRSPQALLDSLDRDQYLFGGQYGAREKYAEMIRGLVDAGKIDAAGVKELLGEATGKNGNKIKLSTWKEFDGLEQYAIDKARERERKQYDDIVFEDKKADQQFGQILERDRDAIDDMTPLQRREFIDRYKESIGRPGMEDTPEMKSLMNQLERDEEETEKLIKSYIDADLPIPSHMLHTKALRDKYGNRAQASKWADEQTQKAELQVQSILKTALGLTDGKIDPSSNPKYTRGLPIAMRYTRVLFNQYRLENPGVPDAQINKMVIDEITKMAGKPGDFNSSPFYFENEKFPTPKEKALNTSNNALEFLEREVGAGNFNVFDKEFIPGTDKEYQQLVSSIEKGEPEIPELYHTLARTMPGVSASDIAMAQLNVRGGPELVPTELEEVIPTLSPETQNILAGKAQFLTPQRLDRAVVTQRASDVNMPAVQSLLDYVVQDESGGNYNIIYGGRTIEGLEDMTIGQVIQEQHANVSRTGGGAVGKYQMIRPEEAARAVGLKLTDKFSKENQDKMAMYYLELAGYSRFMKGQISAKSFARGLASQWAALHTAEGGSYYQDGTNKAGGSTTYQGLLERVQALAAASPFNAPQNISPSLR